MQVLKKPLTNLKTFDIIKASKERKVLKMTREKMLDNIIRKWGFEHTFTIIFATIIEDKNFTYKMVADLYKGLMDL